MYTLLELESITFGALKKIGSELNVLPEGDRRCRKSWIDAIAGVNPPLLQLLEFSLTAEVEQVQPIIETVETSAGVEIEQAQEPIKVQAQEPISQVAKTSPGVEVDPVSEPISQVAKTSPGVEVEQAQGAIKVQAQEPIESKFGRIVYPRPAQNQKSIAPWAETSPGVKVAQVQESIKLGDWVKVNREPRLAAGVKRGEIFQVLRVNSNGVLVIENPHENPKYILSARLGFLDPSEVCLVPRSNRLDTPAFIDVVSRNFPDRLQELLQNPPGVEVDRVQEPVIEMVEASGVEDRLDDVCPECSECFGDGYIEDEFGLIPFF